MKKNIYVVLGMPRSGTSAITRGLQALGIDLGEKLQPADSINPKGFYEDVDIMYKINRGVSHIIDDVWMRDNAMEAGQPHEEELRILQDGAVNLIRERMQHTMHWGFKDTRTGHLIPFWKSVFKRMDVNVNYIIVIRNPLSRAFSNQTFNDIDLEGGLIEGLHYFKYIIEATRGLKRMVVSYEAMMQDPRGQLDRIHNVFAISLEKDEQAIRLYADQFLDKNLRHYRFNEAEMRAHPAVKTVPHSMDVYLLLSKLATDELEIDTSAFLTAWADLYDQIQQASPLYRHINTLLLREKALKRQKKGMEKSLPWKIIFPLRIIDNALRSLKHTIREKWRFS